MTAVDRAIAVGAVVVLTGLALALPPRPFGDAPEYLLMAESWAAHGSPELRPGDVDALRRRVAVSGMAASPDDALGNYFEGRDGRFYCYHFSFYPLLTLPARWALGAVGGDVLKAGPLTNAIALGGAIAAVLLLVPAGTWARRAAAALLVSSPALGFLLWPHPEVLSFAMATLALVAGSRGASGLATLCAAIIGSGHSVEIWSGWAYLSNTGAKKGRAGIWMMAIPMPGWPALDSSSPACRNAA